jgi:C1A family cysteine protease
MNRFLILWIFILLVGTCLSQDFYSSTHDFDEDLFNKKNMPLVFNLRDQNRLGNVKVQPTGGCWASAAMGSVESVRKSAGLSDTILSDMNLKLFHGFVPERSNYGNHYMATAYFSRGSGPLLKNTETDSIYNPQPEIFTYLTDARYLPGDPELIKQVIMNYGAVYSMMYFRKKNIDSISFIHYTNKKKINHAIILVGWNDTLKTKKGTGVWIAQNSLGLKSGENGFFYIPYQDPNILTKNAIWPKWIDYNPYAKLYYYDTLGSFYSYGFGDTICYGLVKYEAKDDMHIQKIGTAINFNNAKIYAEIYNEFDTASKKLSGYLGNIDPVNCKFAGYYTIDLNQEIKVEKGDAFYVMMRYVTPNDTTPLPIETKIEGYSNPDIVQNKCWINPNYEKWPTTWYECGSTSPYPTLRFDLCIKAYCIQDK